MSSAFDLRIELVRHEYERAEATIRAYDEHLFKIKGWAITVCSAISLYALNSNRPTMYAVGIFAALSFWVLDAHTKTTQRLFIRRVQTIERFLHSPDLDHAIERQSTEALDLRPLAEMMTSGPAVRSLNLLREARLFNTSFLYGSLILLLVALLVAESV